MIATLLEIIFIEDAPYVKVTDLVKLMSEIMESSDPATELEAIVKSLKEVELLGFNLTR